MVARLAGTLAFAVILCGLLLTPLEATDDAGKVAAAVERAFRPLVKEHQIPGLAVGVSTSGKQYFFYFGVASKEASTPVNADTLFEIGSVSKMFTATLAGYAQATGVLSLNDHPGKFMPQLRDGAIDKISLINLGTYTAGGLPLHLPNAIKTNDEMVAFLQQWKPSASPGTLRQYSNPSAGLLGRVTALAMKGQFVELIETGLLPKLGLKQCFIRVPQAQMQNYAQGYRENKPIRMRQAVFDVEAYGLKCTATDLLRFVEANMRPESLEPSVRLAVEATQVGYFKVGGMVQGWGWEQYPYPVTLARLVAGNSTDVSMKPNIATAIDPPRRPSEPTLFNKTGSTSGFSAYAAFVPERKLGIVMLANASLPSAPRVTAAHALFEALGN
ncbi:MAG: class C beta-lactamase [Pseudorhodoplanes sp.]